MLRRNPSRSRLLLLGAFALALGFLLIPTSESLALRAQLYSLLRPLLVCLQSSPENPPALLSATRGPGGEPSREGTPDAARAAEQDRLRAEAIQLREENLRLRVMLGAAAPSTAGQASSGTRAPRGVTATVIAREVLWQDPVLGLDRGRADGVRVGAGVLYRGVAVGRIVSAGPSAACLALLTHRGVRVAARLADCRADGVLQGTRDAGSERLCKLTVIAPDLQARQGEHVVSSGLDGSFPPGCWLGDVSAVVQKGNLEWELTVRPACDAARLEAVYVLTDPPAEVPWPAAGRGRR
jgi:cell shape-determining protein MreC